ncbi:MAG: alpha-xylosidase [Treponema sp.]|jgi:alpha-D-xyloside xylohydrolase|nr:alpha-xylosidase [Treponema sp.]
MKFRDGYWEIREGVKNFNLGEVHDTQITGCGLTVYSTIRKTYSRGERVGITLLTTELSSPMPDVIRVKMYRRKGKALAGPQFPLPPAKKEHINIKDDKEAAVFSAGKLAFRIPKEGPWRGIFSREGKELTEIIGRLSGFFSCASARGNFAGASIGDIRLDSQQEIQGLPAAYLAQYLKLSVGEAVYGLGERFTNFIKNGQTVDIWNEDGGTSSEQAYKNIPFYITNRGYGVFVNNPGKVSFEAGSEVVNAVQFSVSGEEADYYVISGDTLRDVLRNYTSLTGKPALPPAWSFGLWLTTSFTTNYDEETVNHFIDGMAQRKLPLSVFHFDCFWMKECQWVDFEWDKTMFPDPKGMLARLKNKGLKICVWINPYIAQKSPLFDEAMARGYLVKRASGDVWQWDRWQFGMGLVDFTNPGAVEWYRGKLRSLTDMGVDCFKTDFGERIPTDVVWYDGSDPEKMHNYYALLYNRAVFNLLEEERGSGDAVVFARSAATGGQSFPVHWGGDCAASYESMAETLRGGLSLGLCGFGFWSHDISGFEQTATADLFKRWIAFGLLSSHSRLHGSQSYRVPWNFDEEACDVTRFFTELKHRLMPYLWSAAVTAHKEGIPMLRAMILEFPDDPACTSLDLQYVFGPSLLTAPIFNEDGEASYYLPPGRWTNIISGELIDGGPAGLWRREKYNYFSLPLLAKPCSLIPFGPAEKAARPDYDYAASPCFHLFELDDGKSANAGICDFKGDIVIEAEVSRKGSRISAAVKGANKTWKLLLRGIKAGKVTGGKSSEVPEGLLIEAAAAEIEIDL